MAAALGLSFLAAAVLLSSGRPWSQVQPPAPAPARASDAAPRVPNDPRYGLLTPLPEKGGVPPIVEMLAGMSAADLAERARARDYTRQIGEIRHKYLSKRVAALREEGLALLREFTDPGAFLPMVDACKRDDDEIRLAVLNHVAAQGDPGQAALAWVNILDEDPAIRNEALLRMVSPASKPVVYVLDQALRSPDHTIASNAGALAGALNVLEVIPLLIQAQVSTTTTRGGEGDLAWIAVEKQTVYVERLEAVVGDNSGAFIPITNTLTEGFVMRVLDAVVIVYRTIIHDVLVSMTSADWGQPTGELAYDVAAWTEWYNGTYVPFKNEQAIIDRMAADPAAPPAP